MYVNSKLNVSTPKLYSEEMKILTAWYTLKSPYYAVENLKVYELTLYFYFLLGILHDILYDILHWNLTGQRISSK